MKKLVTILLIMLLALCAGCGMGQEETVCRFTYHGISMTPGMEAAPVLKALGEPVSYTEEASCASDGLDKTYCFGSFYIATFPQEGKDIIGTIWFADGSVATEEGIALGAAREQVVEAYGNRSALSTNAYQVDREGTRLTVLLEEDVVTAVRYEAVF